MTHSGIIAAIYGMLCRRGVSCTIIGIKPESYKAGIVPHSRLCGDRDDWLAEAHYHGPTPIVRITMWMIVTYQDDLVRMRIYRPWGSDLETTPPPLWIYHQDFVLADPDFDSKLADAITIVLRSPPPRWRGYGSEVRL